LLGRSATILAEKENRELELLPEAAREELREYFHGICLNVHGFVENVSSEAFVSRLRACTSEQLQQELLNVTFSQKVVTGTEVLNRLRTVCKDLGGKLDLSWKQCRTKLASEWQAVLPQRGMSWSSTLAASDLDKSILDGLHQARAKSYPLGERPALDETLMGIGESALLLLPMARVGPAAWPIFVLRALGHVWSYISARLLHRSAGFQLAITESLAQLGNWVGTECEQEFRRRIADLHHWQQSALDSAAEHRIDTLIPWFI
jgi:hypothetical protein